MKNLLIALFVLFAFTQCKKDDVAPDAIIAEFGEDFKLVPNQKLVIFADANTERAVAFQLAEAIEGRCPDYKVAGATCLIFGNAKIKLVAPNDQFGPLEMCLGDCDDNKFNESDSVIFRLYNQEYRVTFKSMNSDYDKKKAKSHVKDVTLLVEKL